LQELGLSRAQAGDLSAGAEDALGFEPRKEDEALV
jgi:hypothetical protein